MGKVVQKLHNITNTEWNNKALSRLRKNEVDEIYSNAINYILINNNAVQYSFKVKVDLVTKLLRTIDTFCQTASQIRFAQKSSLIIDRYTVQNY
ncbi:UNKNOWN [Stylonychia lemnae]|uniref:Uncharacterized protein n=1 Tax=Stylonychia lemnae TaxID=5949 RepID=A0A078BA29_STYLE|nr:UNKNOWN [Stylonychia lemnae]|eukprot:CDW91096.1 UNKNOWN [Stylonychia lemnae]